MKEESKLSYHGKIMYNGSWSLASVLEETLTAQLLYHEISKKWYILYAEKYSTIQESFESREEYNGKRPSSRPVKKTTGNSKPLEACTVIMVTLLV